MKRIILYLILSANIFGLYLQAKGNEPKTATLSDTIFIGPTESQKLDQYIADLAENDIYITKLPGYKAFDTRGRERVVTPRFYPFNVDKRYPIGLEAINGDAIILLPEVKFDKNGLRESFYIENELRNSKRDTKLDIRPLINVITETDMSKYANADTAVIYELDHFYDDVPYIDVYNYCIGIYLRKYSHPSMLLKILLTRDAYQHKEQYLSLLLDNIKYGNKIDSRYVAWENEMSKYKDLDFPTIKKQRPGIVLETDEDLIESYYYQYKRLYEFYKTKKETHDSN